MTVVWVALAAAVAFGCSTALMHHGVSSAPSDVRGFLMLLRHAVSQWRWLLGFAASLAGLGLHATALHLGSLAVVQPIVVSGLVFGLVFRAALERRLLRSSEMAMVILVAVGLCLFLVAAGSSGGRRHPSEGAALVVLAVGAAGATAGWRLSRRARPHRAGFLLGAAAGVVFGLIAGTLKVLAGAVAGQASVFTTWPLYVLIVLGVVGFLLNQKAYHVAPLAASLPALNVVNPVVALVFGVTVFGEQPGSDATAVLLETVGFGMLLVGIALLARSDAPPSVPLEVSPEGVLC